MNLVVLDELIVSGESDRDMGQVLYTQTECKMMGTDICGCRIIHYQDSTQCLMAAAGDMQPSRVEAWVRALEGTHVGVLAWSASIPDVCFYDTKVGDRFGLAAFRMNNEHAGAGLDSTAASRGERRPLLGVRIGPSVSVTQSMGIDLRAWVDRGLVDYIVPAGFPEALAAPEGQRSVVTVDINGHRIADSLMNRIHFQRRMYGFAPDLPPHYRYDVPLEAPSIRRGTNEIGFTVLSKNHQLAGELTICETDIIVKGE